ncbi:iron uptake transporter permease EfeU [Aeromicrobium wangtongii]|uniref:iron uptake transporter permease EfeU n=1 Tax=Aeromicrobium wangtongii TaxID=2969247 RepID=UPI00201781C3|nr:iron uptake transporter permease EfeU [Aeromicrobium wangtongii]MCL3819034.1 FTR1 family protein [Aeromicrobium wangtongii]
MLANFLIGLREGLEASLVVSILIAYLVKTGRRHDIRHIWAGVATAVVLVVAIFTAINIAMGSLPFRTQELVGGSLSVLAAGLVTWMIFWMRRTARGLKKGLESELEDAVTLGPLAVAVVAFLTVGREGLETAAIMYGTVAYTDRATPFIGSAGGLLVAVVLGYLIYRGAITVDLGRFFTVTGYLLIIVAAGVLAYGVYDLQEAGFLPRLTGTVGGIGHLGNAVFDISSTIPPDSWYGTLLKGTVNFQPNPSWLQSIAWAGYLIPVLWMYSRKPRPAGSQPQPTAVGAATD